jgi:glycosyltransferase involved in cell wall biosynthesis
MRLTVAICTWNRAKLLDQTLTQMHRLRVPPGVDWELLVVNNSSTDDTDAVVARHAGQLPLNRLVETRQGLSHARNCAMAAAQGDLMVWTDDDLLVDPEWLAEYARAAEAWPDAAYFGGAVDPWFETTPPDWIVRNLACLESVYALRDLGPDVRPLRPDEGIVGASMAFRRRAIEGMQFNPDLGRKGALLTSGDDSDFLERVQQRGGHGIWVGASRVRHFIPTARLNARYVWDWHHAYARFRVRCAPPESFCGPRLWGAPRWVLGMYWKARLRCALLSPLKNRSWFDAFTDCARWRGTMDCLRESSISA